MRLRFHRFREEMLAANRELTLAGAIVLADRVLVVNPGGHVGQATSREIAYAHATGKPVSFTDPA